MKPYVPSCEEEARYLAAYDPSKYKNPAVTADIALFGREEEALFLLLIRRGGYPYKGYFALPGGFIHISESVPAGAARELLEETGVQGVKLYECGVLSEPERDPRQRVISVLYWAEVEKAAVRPAAGDDAAAAEWFRFSEYSCQGEKGNRQYRFTLSGSETFHIALQEVWENGILHYEQMGDCLANDHAQACLMAYLGYLREQEGVCPGRFSPAGA